MPAGFMEKTKDFYDRVNARVMATDVEGLTRKRLVNLRTDLDSIVDAIMEEVRRSPDGLYTNYLNARVNGTLPLEEACYQVGLQLKAYGIDIANYRNIAGVVLGVPVVPQVASTVVDVGKGVHRAASPMIQLPGYALSAVGSLSDQAFNRVQQLPSQLPMSGYFQGAESTPALPVAAS